MNRKSKRLYTARIVGIPVPVWVDRSDEEMEDLVAQVHKYIKQSERYQGAGLQVRLCLALLSIADELSECRRGFSKEMAELKKKSLDLVSTLNPVEASLDS